MTKLDKYSFISKAYSRNLGLISLSEQYALTEKKIAIPGMGGVGGHHLINLTRLGIGKFNIADFDSFEIGNTNRQYGAKLSNYNCDKVSVMEKEALDINPFIEINVFKEGINEKNIDSFLEGVDLVIDGLDFFAFNTRRLLFNKAKQKGIYVITAGPIGFSAALLVFSPFSGLSFDKYFDVNDKSLEPEVYLNFALGLVPKATHRNYIDKRYIKINEKQGPSLTIGCSFATSVACTEAIRILLNRPKIKSTPHFYQYDLYERKFTSGYLRWGLKGPIMKIIRYLGKKQIERQENYLRPPELIELSTETDCSNISKEKLNYILTAATLAPSGDNCQPWKFKTVDDTILIYLNCAVDNSLYNFDQRASYISCGAAIFNMIIAASNLSLKVQIQYKNQTDQMDREMRKIATLKFIYDSSVKTSSLVSMISKRHTNRTKFKKIKISSAHVSELTSCSNDKIDIIFTDQSNDIKIVSKIVHQLDRLRCQNKNLHEHLMNHIMFSDEEARLKKYGFHTGNLNISFFEKIFLKITRPWKIANILFNYLGFDFVVADVSRKATIDASGLILIKGQDSSLESYVKIGEIFQELWLKATLLGFDIQPMFIANIFMSINLLKPELLKPKEKRISDLNSQLLSQIFSLKKGEIPYILIRIGKGTIPIQGSLRKELDHFTL